MRLQLVINPAAGGGRGAKKLPAVRAALVDHDLVVTPTRSLEHADELVAAALARLQQAAIDNANVFEQLMDAVRVCSLGQITNALFEVGGQYRRNM